MKESTAFRILRADALERGMTDLAVMYGWTAIAAGFLELEAHAYAVRNALTKGAPHDKR